MKRIKSKNHLGILIGILFFIMAILSIVAFSLEVSSSRKDCPSENFEGDGDSCKQCPINTYNDGTRLNCTGCPTGQCSPAGSISATACTTCPPAPGTARWDGIMEDNSGHGSGVYQIYLPTGRDKDSIDGITDRAICLSKWGTASRNNPGVSKIGAAGKILVESANKGDVCANCCEQRENIFSYNAESIGVWPQGQGSPPPHDSEQWKVIYDPNTPGLSWSKPWTVNDNLCISKWGTNRTVTSDPTTKVTDPSKEINARVGKQDGLTGVIETPCPS